MGPKQHVRKVGQEVHSPRPGPGPAREVGPERDRALASEVGWPLPRYAARLANGAPGSVRGQDIARPHGRGPSRIQLLKGDQDTVAVDVRDLRLRAPAGWTLRD